MEYNLLIGLTRVGSDTVLSKRICHLGYEKDLQWRTGTFKDVLVRKMTHQEILLSTAIFKPEFQSLNLSFINSHKTTSGKTSSWNLATKRLVSFVIGLFSSLCFI